MIYHWKVKYMENGHVMEKMIYSTVHDLGNKCMNECIYDYLIISLEKCGNV